MGMQFTQYKENGKLSLLNKLNSVEEVGDFLGFSM